MGEAWPRLLSLVVGGLGWHRASLRRRKAAIILDTSRRLWRPDLRTWRRPPCSTAAGPSPRIASLGTQLLRAGKKRDVQHPVLVQARASKLAPFPRGRQCCATTCRRLGNPWTATGRLGLSMRALRRLLSVRLSRSLTSSCEPRLRQRKHSGKPCLRSSSVDSGSSRRQLKFPRRLLALSRLIHNARASAAIGGKADLDQTTGEIELSST